MTNERGRYEYLTSGEGSNSWSYLKSAKRSNSPYLKSTDDGNSYGQHNFGLYQKEGASDGQNQQSSLALLSFQDLNPLYNNTTQVQYLFYNQNATSLANDTPINGFIEPSYDYHVIQNQLCPQLM
ncbi:hypothetical protein F8M41_003038 [Gigaspora margarita]|uniref:Uncharacterized protein n=1 Tax=Gigaspora margarita TaxID=4874 RepID=A0A8H4AYK2_GIGMA|nr:hypothetical protein F8M41_003038 [Gigaspora margarita]